jgi:catechol 2,3-dioxygenase-like lactoylglutathione lyase family enzyme
MRTLGITPILNVSDLNTSFQWFEKLGWQKAWDWSAPGGPPTFGAVSSDHREIFLCVDAQGGRGTGSGMWIAIFVDDVDAVHARCMQERLEVLYGPEDEPWGIREMHVRHPDGHVFRIGHGLEHSHEDGDHDHDHPHPH